MAPEEKAFLDRWIRLFRIQWWSVTLEIFCVATVIAIAPVIDTLLGGDLTLMVFFTFLGFIPPMAHLAILFYQDSVRLRLAQVCDLAPGDSVRANDIAARFDFGRIELSGARILRAVLSTFSILTILGCGYSLSTLETIGAGDILYALFLIVASLVFNLAASRVSRERAIYLSSMQNRLLASSKE